MTHWIVLLLLALVLPSNTMAAEEEPAPGLPQMDIYLLWLSWENGTPQIQGEALNATNRTGYDNQPAFTVDGKSFYCTSGTPDGHTDIFLYSLEGGEPKRITETEGEGEYSPRPTPKNTQLSYIHQAAGEVGGQVFLDALEGGSAKAADARGPFGYYAWNAGQDRLAVFALTDPFRLDVFGIQGDTTRISVHEEIGRALYAAPDHESVYFTAALNDSVFGVYQSDFKGTKAQLVFDLPQGSQDYVVFKNSNGADAFMAVKGEELVYKESTTAGWVVVGNLSELGLKSISRLAIRNNRSLLAVVAEDP